MSYKVHVKDTNIQFTAEQLAALEQHLRELYLQREGGNEVSLSREMAADLASGGWHVDKDDLQGERVTRIRWLLEQLECSWTFESYFPYGDHRVARRYEIGWPDDTSLYDDEGVMEDLKRCFAPVVPEGGYVEMVGEDDDRWRYVFANQQVTQKSPKVSW